MNKEKRVIIAFIADLMFGTKFENVARLLEYQPIVFTDEVDMGRQLMGTEQSDGGDLNQLPGEALEGNLGALFHYLTQQQPALMVIDLGNNGIPWERWLMSLKSSPATRRIPILAYGAHVETELFQRARVAGADIVVPRSRFMKQLPKLIEEHVRQVDEAGWAHACGQGLTETAVRGLELFEAGDYFAAHEYLEEAWHEEAGMGRELYRAILQIAIAYLQIERRNYKGAIKMFLRARQWLDPLPNICRGIDIAQLRSDAEVVFTQLQEIGKENMAEWDQIQLPSIIWEK